VSLGGTGITAYTSGDLLTAVNSSTLTPLLSVETGNVLVSTGVSSLPSWQKVGLSTHTSGVLPIANGGTNTSTTLANNRLMFSSGNGIREFSTLLNGQLPIGSGGGAPVAANLTAGNGVAITNGFGSITISQNQSCFMANSVTSVQTTSLTDVLLDGMVLTPGAGDYLVFFSGLVENTNTDKQGTITIYVNGLALPYTTRQELQPGGRTAHIGTMAYVTGLLAGQIIDVRWNVQANTGTFYQRSLIALKLK
jgi:hypothetical protein